MSHAPVIERLTPEDYLSRLPDNQADERAGTSPSSKSPMLEQALLAMDDRSDPASGKDGAGFNRSDFANLAPHIETARAGGCIEPPNRPRVAKILYKYAAQLMEQGFNTNTLAAEEKRLADEARPAKKTKGDSDEPSQMDKLLDLAEDWKLLIFDGQAYASVVTHNAGGTSKRDTLRFSRTGVRKKLQHLYYLEYDTGPSSEALTAAMGILEAKADFEGTHVRVWIRTAFEDGRVYLDLADEQGRAVVVSATGWEITDDPPVYFQRTQGMLPLPEPVRGGTLNEIKDFVNLDATGFILCVAWVLHALFPEYPHAILLLEGGQGCGKSSLARLLRSLFDPHAVALRKAPKDDEDIAVAAANNWAVVYDNLSGLSGQNSDAICGLSTGSGHARRAHYSNDEEASFSYLRPVMVTMMPGKSGKSDVVERTLKVEPPSIPEGSRKLESELVGNGEWEAARPRILGAFLDALACSLRNTGKKRLQRLPRMADFAQFVVNAEDALPFSAAEFLQAFEESRQDQVEGMLEADPVASAIRNLMITNPTWESSIAFLHERLTKGTTIKAIPNARALSVRLRLAEANLRTIGINVRFQRSNGKRLVSIDRQADKAGNFAALNPFCGTEPDGIRPNSVPQAVPQNQKQCRKKSQGEFAALTEQQKKTAEDVIGDQV